MKVGDHDPVLVQRQFRTPEPLLIKASFIDPLGEALRRIRKTGEEDTVERRDARPGEIDLRA